jgi:hypothetical protein
LFFTILTRLLTSYRRINAGLKGLQQVACGVSSASEQTTSPG